ncbi:MAG: hypothetical protein A2190_04695 [Lysobacterales bacterium RIFOXYA1_FULL_69_10]|nr:MAG: hypothetical protein A2190_04695 [Xanthomonadales bacterium RIFOXYA1_FULL_69_10]
MRRGQIVATDRHDLTGATPITASSGPTDGLVLLHTGSDGSAVWGVYSGGNMVGLLIRQPNGDLSYSAL